MIPTWVKDAIERGESLREGSQFDAIVVGSGAAGGMAALRLCEGGLNVLLLEAGLEQPFWSRPLTATFQLLTRTAANSPLALRIARPVARLAQKALRAVGSLRQPIQTQCFAWERMPQAFVDDLENPYSTPKGRPFMDPRPHSRWADGYSWPWMAVLSPCRLRFPTRMRQQAGVAHHA